MYFKNFPKIYYNFNIRGTDTLLVVKDITLNLRVVKEVLSNIYMYDEYYIKDGETPEIIAEKFYGDPTLHWVIMLVNERFDYVNDFPKSELTLEQYVEEKYKDPNPPNIIPTTGYEYGRNGHHKLFGRWHYVTADGVVSDLPDGVELKDSILTAVSNYDYETKINEQKRNIKLISKDYINVFIDNIQDAFKTNV